jgi:hypothetical protein
MGMPKAPEGLLTQIEVPMSDFILLYRVSPHCSKNTRERRAYEQMEGISRFHDTICAYVDLFFLLTLRQVSPS